MLIKIFIPLIVFLNGVMVDDNVDEVFQKCVSLKDFSYCSEYTLMTVLKKIKMESTDTVIQHLNYTDLTDTSENVTKLMHILEDFLFSNTYNNETVLTMDTALQKRSLEESRKHQGKPLCMNTRKM